LKNILKLFIFLFLINSTLYSKESIKWLIWELNPEFIHHGKQAQQGYADKFLKTFIKKLPEYNHTIIWLNTKRWFKESSKYGSCTPHIWKRFKLDDQYYSEPYTLTSPHGILIHKKNVGKFGEEGDILSLENILKDNSLMLTVPLVKYKDMGSRYPILYKYFKPYIGEKNVQEITTNANEINPKMLDKNRTDYLIAYPTTAQSFARINNEKNNYIFYSIKEDPYYKKIYVSCDKSSLGKEVIEKINTLFTQELYEEFLSYHEEWNNKNPQFRKKYTDYFIKGIEDKFIIQ